MKNQHSHVYTPNMAYAGHMIQETQQEKSNKNHANSSFRSYQNPVGLTMVLDIALLQDPTAPLRATKYMKAMTNVHQ